MNDEEFITDDMEPAEEMLRESWPISPDAYAKELEEQLMDLDLRF